MHRNRKDTGLGKDSMCYPEDSFLVNSDSKEIENEL